MLDEKQIELELRETILDICEVLYHKGYRSIPVGAMMRLIGVPDERAALHDGEFFGLDEDFVRELANRRCASDQTIPPGTTIH